jgi:hypothetical protein
MCDYHFLGPARHWWEERFSYGDEWRDTAFFIGSVTQLSASEMKDLSDNVDRVIAPYRGRDRDKSKRPPGALPVQFIAYAHPLSPRPQVG